MKYIKLYIADILIFGVLAVVSEFVGAKLWAPLYFSLSQVIWLLLVVRWGWKAIIVLPFIIASGIISGSHGLTINEYLVYGLSIATLMVILPLMKLYEIKFKFDATYKYVLLFILMYLVFIGSLILFGKMFDTGRTPMTVIFVHGFNIVLGIIMTYILSKQKTMLVQIGKIQEAKEEITEDIYESANE